MTSTNVNEMNKFSRKLTHTDELFQAEILHDSQHVPNKIKASHMQTSIEIKVSELAPSFVNKEGQVRKDLNGFVKCVYEMIFNDTKEFMPLESFKEYLLDTNLQHAYIYRKSNKTKFEVKRKNQSAIENPKKVEPEVEKYKYKYEFGKYAQDQQAIKVVEKWRDYFDAVQRDNQYEQSMHCPLHGIIQKDFSMTNTQVIKVDPLHPSDSVQSDIVSNEDSDADTLNDREYSLKSEGYPFVYEGRQYVLKVGLNKKKEAERLDISVHDSDNYSDFASLIVTEEFKNLSDHLITEIIRNLVIYTIQETEKTYYDGVTKTSGQIDYIALKGYELNQSKTSVVKKKIVSAIKKPSSPDKKPSSPDQKLETLQINVEKKSIENSDAKHGPPPKYNVVKKTRKVHKYITRREYEERHGRPKKVKTPSPEKSSCSSEKTIIRQKTPSPEKKLDKDTENLLDNLGLDKTKLFLIIKIQAKVKTFIARMKFKKTMKNVMCQFYAKVVNSNLTVRIIIKKINIAVEHEKIVKSIKETFVDGVAVSSEQNVKSTEIKSTGITKEAFKIMFEIQGIKSALSSKQDDPSYIQDQKKKGSEWVQHIGRFKELGYKVNKEHIVETRTNKDGVSKSEILKNKYNYFVDIGELICVDKVHRLYALGYFRQVVQVYFENAKDGFTKTCQEYNHDAIVKAKAENLRNYRTYLAAKTSGQVNLIESINKMSLDNPYLTAIGTFQEQKFDEDNLKTGKIIFQTKIKQKERDNFGNLEEKEYSVTFIQRNGSLIDHTSWFAKFSVREKNKFKTMQHSVSALQCHQFIYKDKKLAYRLTISELQAALQYELNRSRWKEFAKSIRVINDKTILKVNQTYVDAFVKKQYTYGQEQEIMNIAPDMFSQS